MMNEIRDFITSVPDIDIFLSVLDLAIISYIVYRALLLMRGTRALQMLIGVVFVLGLFFVSQEDYLNLQTVNWVLDKFVSSFILVLIVLFQPDIRRALSQMGRNPLFMQGSRKSGASMYDEIIRGVSRLSAKHIGALVVMERDADLTVYTDEAIPMDARVTADTLFSIFIPSHENPLHDGAAIIRQGRISHAGCFLPLTDSPKVDKALGTRHRAAIGLSEITDALVIVVSEESGTVSVCSGGEIVRGLDSTALRDRLMTAFGPRAHKEKDHDVR
jgi:uncharacterized protein (TIGR00159 family)